MLPAADSSYVLETGSKTGDCTYDYTPSLTPTITSLNPPSAIAAGTILTITGTGLSTVASENVVAFQLGVTGALAFDFEKNVKCGSVAIVTPGTVITCLVPDLSAGSYTVQVNVANIGLNAPNPAVGQVVYTLRIDSIGPLSGSTSGGTLVILRGSGFVLPTAVPSIVTDNGGDLIQIGGVTCQLVDVTVTIAVCRTAAGAAATVPITVNGGAQTQQFVYDAAFTPQINTLDPILVSSAVTNLITITGTGFVANSNLIPPASLNVSGLAEADDASIFNPFAVNFGDRWCHVLTVSATQIVCRLARAAPPNLHSTTNARAPTVYVAGQGYASNPSNLSIDIALRVHSLSVSQGSLAGGSILTITGEGFKPQKELVTDTSVSVDPNYISVSIQIYKGDAGQFPNITNATYAASEAIIPCHVMEYEMNYLVPNLRRLIFGPVLNVHLGTKPSDVMNPSSHSMQFLHCIHMVVPAFRCHSE
jgi:hypothetical protein